MITTVLTQHTFYSAQKVQKIRDFSLLGSGHWHGKFSLLNFLCTKKEIRQHKEPAQNCGVERICHITEFHLRRLVNSTTLLANTGGKML